MSELSDWPVFAGIDWGGEHHQLCVVDPAGQRRFDALVLADTLRHEHQNWRALLMPSPLLA